VTSASVHDELHGQQYIDFCSHAQPTRAQMQPRRPKPLVTSCIERQSPPRDDSSAAFAAVPADSTDSRASNTPVLMAYSLGRRKYLMPYRIDACDESSKKKTENLDGCREGATGEVSAQRVPHASDKRQTGAPCWISEEDGPGNEASAQKIDRQALLFPPRHKLAYPPHSIGLLILPAWARNSQAHGADALKKTRQLASRRCRARPVS
jgi:hypothetical protein